MRVIVTGSDKWATPFIIAETLRDLPEDAILVHGNSKGAERMAEDGWGKRWLRTTEVHPALWDRKPDGSYNRGAAYQRNERMVATGADLCFAFLANGDANKGPRHCAGLALKAGIPVVFVHADGKTTRVEPGEENPFAPVLTDWEKQQQAAWETTPAF